MSSTEVFVALGGNLGDTFSILKEAIKQIKALGVRDFAVSQFYQTTPVSSLAQNCFVNAVCKFKTSLTALALLNRLQEIEMRLGKVPKPKEAPRIIDLDILFFGLETHKEAHLEIPHPRWRDRLFVLVPLADLVKEIYLPQKDHPKQGLCLDIFKILREFSNKHDECVTPLGNLSLN